MIIQLNPPPSNTRDLRIQNKVLLLMILGDETVVVIYSQNTARNYNLSDEVIMHGLFWFVLMSIGEVIGCNVS